MKKIVKNLVFVLIFYNVEPAYAGSSFLEKIKERKTEIAFIIGCGTGLCLSWYFMHPQHKNPFTPTNASTRTTTPLQQLLTASINNEQAETVIIPRTNGLTFIYNIPYALYNTKKTTNPLKHRIRMQPSNSLRGQQKNGGPLVQITNAIHMWDKKSLIQIQEKYKENDKIQNALLLASTCIEATKKPLINIARKNVTLLSEQLKLNLQKHEKLGAQAMQPFIGRKKTKLNIQEK